MTNTVLRAARRRLADPLFNAAVVAILISAMIAVVYPLYFVVISSVSEPARVYEGSVWFWPIGFTLDGYARLLTDPAVWRGGLLRVSVTPRFRPLLRPVWS
jgi:putative aldouronate transport system permease protein